MAPVSEAPRPQAIPPAGAALGDHPPQCCGQDMHMLLRRAVLHSDGSVVYQAAWGCRICGRRVL